LLFFFLLITISKKYLYLGVFIYFFVGNLHSQRVFPNGTIATQYPVPLAQ